MAILNPDAIFSKYFQSTLDWSHRCGMHICYIVSCAISIKQHTCSLASQAESSDVINSNCIAWPGVTNDDEGYSAVSNQQTIKMTLTWKLKQLFTSHLTPHTVLHSCYFASDKTCTEHSLCGRHTFKCESRAQPCDIFTPQGAKSHSSIAFAPCR